MALTTSSLNHIDCVHTIPCTVHILILDQVIFAFTTPTELKGPIEINITIV